MSDVVVVIVHKLQVNVTVQDARTLTCTFTIRNSQVSVVRFGCVQVQRSVCRMRLRLPVVLYPVIGLGG